ncbi:MAG: O-antigen ligase family protein [Stygiobacter sp.]
MIDKYWQTDVRVVSPWSIFIFVSAFILIFYNEKVETALLFNHWFQFLSLLSLIFISLYTLTYLFLIEGNVDKSFIGTGGIGLNNFSTNETGFYAVTLGISWFYLQKFKKGLPGFLAIIFMFIFFTITILTKSRISSLLFLLIVFGDLFSKRNIWGYRLLVLSLLMIMTFFGLNEILDRFQTDYRTSYNYLLPEIPFTGSGRTLIWYYFLDNFFRSDIISLLFGVGDFGIIKIYDSTPLKNLGVYSASTKSFLPLHSEIFDILISGGLLSLLAFSLVVYFILKKYKNFYDLKLMIIGLSFYLFFDMVVYNFIALLIFSLNIIFILKNESIDE